MFKINEIFVEIFIKSYKKSSKEIILDFDGTDDKVHGNQIGAMFYCYYNYKYFCHYEAVSRWDVFHY